jgi:lipopolysaccharide transport system ATP-binding protein
MIQPAITAESISKIYHLFDAPIDRLKETLHPFRKKYHTDFYALDNISFSIAKGETIGIVGKNGSGKSTLLKIICGVTCPTAGKLTINGKISALLELGAGFNLELSGTENIYFNAAIMGHSRAIVEDKLDEILAFADIGDFIHQPVKNYSSGMFVRLAFSIATAVEPDILIVDEALSVGDMFFQAKCISRMQEMIRSGVTLLFVSHDLAAIKGLCQKSLLINQGRLLAYEKSDSIVERYFAMRVRKEQEQESDNEFSRHQHEKVEQHQAFSPNGGFLERSSVQRILNGKVRFVNVQLLNANLVEIEVVSYGEELILRMAIEAMDDAANVAFGYHIRDKNGVDVIYSDCIIEEMPLLQLKKSERRIVDWRFKAELGAGNYNISVVLSTIADLHNQNVEIFDFIPFSCQFQMSQRSGSPLYGLVHWNNQVDTTTIDNVS